MSLEHEPNPEVHIPWKMDNEGYYINISNGTHGYQMRESNSAIYSHSEDPRLDHVFVMIGEDDDQMYGLRLWRGLIEQIIGKGAFDVMVNQMRQHDFAEILADYPTDQDIEFYEDWTKEEYQRPNPIDKIVELAMSNFEAHWEYMQGEPGWS